MALAEIVNDKSINQSRSRLLDRKLENPAVLELDFSLHVYYKVAEMVRPRTICR
jgi:hypothetical protein